MSTTMKAVIASEAGAPSVLQLREYPKPEINQPDHVLIRIHAAGVNPIDTKLRSGTYPSEFPAILGCDGSGVIEAVGESVSYFSPDDEVYFFFGGLNKIPGNYAEYIVVPELNIAKKPNNVTFVQAAAAPLVCLTAWESLFDRTNIKQNHTVLIHAGAGGVGHVAIQLAKQAGAKVATTVGSDKKAEWAKSLGADLAINYNCTNFVEATQQWTNGAGVDLVMDNVGGSVLTQSFAATKVYGDVVSLLPPSQDIDWTVARFRNLRFIQEAMLMPLLLNLDVWQKHQTNILNKCGELIQQGELKIHVSHTYTLDEVSDAHEQIESGRTLGKLVVKIN